jgi:DHA2 family multidrug resistance protein
MVMSPLSTHIARLLDLRAMPAIEFGLFALSMYLTATLTNQTGFWELLVRLSLRGLGLICCYLPANMIAMDILPPDTLKNAAGLYNLTRDLGGAIGLATIVTLMNERVHFHWSRLIENINPVRPVVQHFLDTQTNRLDSLISGDSNRVAVKMLADLV